VIQLIGMRSLILQSAVLTLIVGSITFAADKTPPTTRYLKATTQQSAAAIAQARKVAGDVEAQIRLKLTEFQTPHFIVFTDWDPREFGFLRTNLEGAYSAVARQFEIPAKENVFIGKLPVFMFARYEDFEKFATQYDDAPPSKNVRGYFAQARDGTGHMAMWKPVAEGNGMTLDRAERDWAYTLTHEFTHAFVARYRTNRKIPRWMNEGLAEIVAQGQFPSPDRRMRDRQMAVRNNSIAELFDDEHVPGGEWYPVMQGLVETLIARDRAGFIKLFNAIKDGDDPADAMKRIYGWDYGALEKAWREYAMRG
jgi:hypothetical protein